MSPPVQFRLPLPLYTDLMRLAQEDEVNANRKAAEIVAAALTHTTTP